MDEEAISLQAPPSPTFIFNGYTSNIESAVTPLPYNYGQGSFKYPEHHGSPVKRQRDYATRTSVKRRRNPNETEALGDVNIDDAMDSQAAAALHDVFNDGPNTFEPVDPEELGETFDEEYEAYAEAALAGVASFDQIQDTLFVVQGWDKRVGIPSVRK